MDRLSPDCRVLVLGGSGMVGSALLSLLRREGLRVLAPTSAELDLRRQDDTLAYFAAHRPEFVFHAAALVGGIRANGERGADFIHQNLLMQGNVFEASSRSPVKRLLFFASACMYPRECAQPMQESQLLAGPMEVSSEPYAVAKLAGVKTAAAFRRQFGRDFFSVVPASLYGENDDFDPQSGHVISSLIARIEEARCLGLPAVEVWGSGKPERDFLYVGDLAEACLRLMQLPEVPDLVNIGSERGVSIAELAALVQRLCGYEGSLVYRPDLPDGAPRKILDSGRMRALGWSPRVGLEEGILRSLHYYREQRKMVSCSFP